MILLFIITSILYLILTYLVLSLYYKYRKDIEELENRCLQLEKRLPSKIYNDIKDDKELQELVKQHKELLDKCFIFNGGDNMGCGTKGRPRGRRTTSRGGGRGK